MPTSSESCWQAIALMSASNTEGKRGGLRPRRALYQPTKQRILGGHRHERRDIDVESEQEG